ncbi:hypothetical protein RNJ44_04142 [Nakaseomyces bracarensis]|uniref:Autophagy-related protein 6 n=1 Tax=Nakaseomyces bracarensis TaxID=273131 RepID=A0ABR4NU27_9SACH
MSELELDSLKVYKCQNCHLPLQLDPTLLDLSRSQRALLVPSKNEKRTYKLGEHEQELLGKVKQGAELRKALKDDAKDSGYLFVNTIDNVPEISKKMNKNEKEVQEKVEDDISDQGESRKIDLEKSEYESETEREDTTKTLSTQIVRLSKLFEIMSTSDGNIDYPICQDCCNILIKRLKSDYEKAIKERDLYYQFLKRLEKQNSGGLNKETLDEKKKEYQNEGKLLDEEREQLLKELLIKEAEEEELDEELTKLAEKVKLLEADKQQQLRFKNAENWSRIKVKNDIQSLHFQYETELNRLDQLRKTNIYNESFRISHFGPFATINDLRLGSYDDCKVSHFEINAALGQVVLLLVTITSNLNIKLIGYKLQPLGSTSKISRFIEIKNEWETYDLFLETGFNLRKLFKKETGFDRGLESILQVLEQVSRGLSDIDSRRVSADQTYESVNNGENVTRRSVSARSTNSNHVNEYELPYTIDNDLINGITVKLYGAEPNLEWTTAMKFLLTNAKWLLAYSSSKLSKL